MPLFPEVTLKHSAIWRGLNIGLLGGSFNPAHDGHKHLSELALKRLNLDCVWWLVSPQNPLKSPDDMAPLADRLHSAKKIIAGHPRLLATDIEQETGSTYTAHTLAALHTRFPGARFVWLMGSDNLHQIHLWQDWITIFETTPVAVFARPPAGSALVPCPAATAYAKNRVTGPKIRQLARLTPPAWGLLHTPLNPLSATEIRTGRTPLKKRITI